MGENLDSSLEPILNKVVHKHGGVEMIAIGEGLVEYNSNFRFYLTTKLRNPHYLPEVTTKVAVINAGITREGAPFHGDLLYQMFDSPDYFSLS